MSLYGTGRGEGIGAAAIIATFVLLVHWFGAAANTVDTAYRLLFAALPALGGALCYRFLRAQGRSRFAAFLTGAAYGSSPWLAALAQSPRELLAAALAPLALEAACRFDRPSSRRAWLPWTWLCIAAPFLGGNSTIAWLCGGLCLLGLVRTVTCGDRDANLPPLRMAIWTTCGAVLAAGNLVWLDTLAPIFGDAIALRSNDVLALHHTPHRLDIAAGLRVPGPVLLLFAGLGLLRRQRHVDSTTWLALAASGALPTLLGALPFLPHNTPLLAGAPMLAATGWWLTLLAIVVLATAGLDDFLDLPLRRRTALPWLLALCVLLASLLPTFGARTPEREWPLTLGLPCLAALLFAWRRLGILQFKNVLAVAALAVVSLPLLQALPALCARTAQALAMPPAEPLGEGAMPDRWTQLPQPEHAFGLLAAMLLTLLLAIIDRIRTRRSAPVPRHRGAAVRTKSRP